MSLECVTATVSLRKRVNQCQDWIIVRHSQTVSPIDPMPPLVNGETHVKRNARTHCRELIRHEIVLEGAAELMLYLAHRIRILDHGAIGWKEAENWRRNIENDK